MKNISNSNYSEINLIDLINDFYKKKFFSFSVIIICGLLGCFIGYFAKKELSAEFTIKKPNFKIPEYFDTSNHQTEIFLDLFHTYFKMNLLSRNNMIKFSKESVAKSYFKNFSKTEDILNYKFLNVDKILLSGEKNNIYKIIFYYPENLDGVTLLNDYVNFIIKKTSVDVSAQIIKLLENEIYFQEFRKNFFNAGEYENKLKLLIDKNSDHSLYEKKVLEILELDFNIKFLNEKLSKINKPLEFDIVEAEAFSNQVPKKNYILIYSLIGSLIGFFYSLIHVFIKYQKK
jgi:LPS O-antigen subunit length determinant protein (WzzB/FepE family)